MTGHSPTNWIIASREWVHVGDRVELTDGRIGEIVGVHKPPGFPLVRVDGNFPPEPVHPSRIARKHQSQPPA